MVLSCTVIYLYVYWSCLCFCQTGTLGWMVVMAVHPWWLGSCPLFYSSAICHYLLPVICYQWHVFSGFLVVLYNVTDAYSMSWWWVMCVQLSEGGGARGAGGGQSCALHLDQPHRVPRALLEVWHLRWEAEEWGGTALYLRHSNVGYWGITVFYNFFLYIYMCIYIFIY